MRIHLYSPTIDTTKGAKVVLSPCACGYDFKHPIHVQKDGIVCDNFIICACGVWHDANYEDKVNEDFKNRISVPGYVLNEQELEIIKILVE